jgi:hypothetical protein
MLRLAERKRYRFDAGGRFDGVQKGTQPVKRIITDAL